jgi:hypothetical protein
LSTGKSLKQRLAQVRKRKVESISSLPLIAFYGREPDREILRTKMYAAIERSFVEADGSSPTFGLGRSFLLNDGGALVLNVTSSPLEYLVSRGELEGEGDEEGAAGARYHTAIRFRDLIDGAQVKALKSPSWEGTGGGGFGPADIRSFQLDCIKIIGRVRTAMPASWVFGFVEAVVCKDEWFDIEDKDRKSKREETLLALRFGLDAIAAELGYIMEEDFSRRWMEQPAREPSAARRRSPGSKASDPLALRT